MQPTSTLRMVSERNLNKAVCMHRAITEPHQASPCAAAAPARPRWGLRGAGWGGAQGSWADGRWIGTVNRQGSSSWFQILSHPQHTRS